MHVDHEDSLWMPSDDPRSTPVEVPSKHTTGLCRMHGSTTSTETQGSTAISTTLISPRSNRSNNITINISNKLAHIEHQKQEVCSEYLFSIYHSTKKRSLLWSIRDCFPKKECRRRQYRIVVTTSSCTNKNRLGTRIPQTTVSIGGTILVVFGSKFAG